MDRAVLAFLKSEALYPADFTIQADGGREAKSGVGEEDCVSVELHTLKSQPASVGA